MRVDELCSYMKGLLKWENYCKNAELDKEGDKSVIYDATLPIYGRSIFDKV